MDNNQQLVNTIQLCNEYNQFNSKSIFVHRFGKLPNIATITRIRAEEALVAFMEKYAAMVDKVHHQRSYEFAKKKYFGKTIVILNTECIIEFDYHWCEVLYTGEPVGLLQELLQLFQPLKDKQRRKLYEINLVVQDRGLELRSMEIKKTKLDLDLFYEDDFRAADEIIRKRLNKKKDKGIVLLHGLPGTGKTTYLRYLVGQIKKRVLFLSPNIANNLVEPEFIQLLIDNPESVLIIEDAENLIMDRRAKTNSAVSNLLNISDGLLADFLNVQLICTFNSPLTMVDNALLRKGRLIAKYEFGKLSVGKSQRLSDHLGFDALITKPMTVAEIANQQEVDQQVQVETIGFKRSIIQN